MDNQFKGPTAWEDYLEALEAAVPVIEAVAVTEYYVTDTYERVARQSGCEARDNQDAKVSRLSPMMTRWWGTWQGVFTAPSEAGWLTPHGLSSGFSRVVEASCVRGATSVFAGVAREAARPRPRLVCTAVRRW